MKIILLVFLVLFFLLLAFMCVPIFSASSYQGPLSDHFDGKRFFNPGHVSKKSMLRILQWWRRRNKAPWPTHVENTAHYELTTISSNEIKVTFINHSTVLIQTETFNVLTDPIWSERASPFAWMGPKRVRNPGMSLDELPHIDMVLISHNHYDHLDIPSLQKIEQQFHPIFIVPLGNKQLLKRNGMSHVIEMDWWQQHQFNQEISVVFLPSRHWSARWLTDRYRTLWGSYGINIVKTKIYFAGDTGYSDNFKTILNRWGKPDLAFLPIGSYLPEWFMQENHLNPYEAVKAHMDLEAKYSIAIHYGTFQLSDEAIDQPIHDLNKALESKNISEKQFMLLQEGQSFIFAKRLM